MMFLGSCYLGDKYCVSTTGIGSNETEMITLKNGKYKDLYITKDTTEDITTDIPATFDVDTILHAPFLTDANAGNISYTLETITALLVRVRKSGDTKWKTVYYQKVETLDDLKIEYVEYLPAGDYDISITPLLNGIMGNLSTASISVELDGIFISNQNEMYFANIGNSFCDTTRTILSQVKHVFGYNKAIAVCNSDINYDIIHFEGGFYQFDKDTCQYKAYMDTDSERTQYQKEVMDFLTDGTVKLLRNPDGRCWVVAAQPSPTDTADTYYANRKITMDFVEVGDYNSAQDLYECNLSDVPEEYWYE